MTLVSTLVKSPPVKRAGRQFATERTRDRDVDGKIYEFVRSTNLKNYCFVGWFGDRRFRHRPTCQPVVNLKCRPGSVWRNLTSIRVLSHRSLMSPRYLRESIGGGI